jgi:UV DNA damage endonuclease
MLEVKDKNLSAVKCINCTADSHKLARLELDWSRYKYLILEKAPAIYQQIRELLKDRNTYPAIEFYHLVESAMKETPAPGCAENAALHVWGYFKSRAAENEKKQFTDRLDQFRQGKTGIDPVKSNLLRLSRKYEQKYLLDSLYFYL